MCVINWNNSTNKVNKVNKTIKSKGFGSSRGSRGSKAQSNGLEYENKTSLSKYYKKITKKMFKRNSKIYEEIVFNNNNPISYVHLSQSTFNTYMEEHGKINKKIIKASGCCNPDDVYIDTKNENLFIIEKKFQQDGGSADEKIQTGVYKKEHYTKLYPSYYIHYIYCLSTWFKNPKYYDVINYLRYYDISVFFEDEDYCNKIIQYILINSYVKNNNTRIYKRIRFIE